MKTNFLLVIVVALLGLLSIGAFYGGGALMISTDGSLIKLPAVYLEALPFKNYFLPGLILFSVFGLLPLMVIFGLIRKPECTICERLNVLKDMHWACTFCLYISFALIIWIQVQIITLQTIFWLQSFYMFYALIMIIILLLTPVRSSYDKKKIS
ncbi:MAG: hypothetical protein K0B15_05580 [Lentimicrobium sp.]|nr:hypothetical protein [Lentimicrobium sp.]